MTLESTSKWIYIICGFVLGAIAYKASHPKPKEVIKTQIVTEVKYVDKIVYRDRIAHQNHYIETKKPDGTLITEKIESQESDKTQETTQIQQVAQSINQEIQINKSGYLLGINYSVSSSFDYTKLSLVGGMRLGSLPVFITGEFPLTFKSASVGILMEIN